MYGKDLVVSQHAENASFLWLLRSHATCAPHYSLADLTKLDLRVEANIDGLRVAGDHGWALCKDAVQDGEVGEIFAASVLAFESGTQDRIDTILNAAASSPELSKGIVSALGWLAFSQAKPHIDPLLASPSSTLRRIAIAASAICRHDPGRTLSDSLSDADPSLRARALRATGELGLESAGDSTRLFDDPDERCRFWAAWSRALIFGDPDAVALLRAAADSGMPARNLALQTSIRRIPPDDACAWIDRLAADPKQIRTAIIAAGALGNPARIPWVMDFMNTPALARVAGEAFTTITGVDLALNDLERKKPEDFDFGPTENPEDEDVAMDPDDHLPWPDPSRISKWWTANGSFPKGIRYLVGQPVSVEWARQVLRSGKQRQRAAAALELAILEPGQPLFNVAAPGFRQQQMLGLRRS
jgi:uncharacterized protein (TIGR02270 family)